MKLHLVKTIYNNENVGYTFAELKNLFVYHTYIYSHTLTHRLRTNRKQRGIKTEIQSDMPLGYGEK